MGYIGNSNPSVTNLGGDIDVNGHQIKSSNNGNIQIIPNGSGTVTVDVLTFPVADGSNGQALVTNGSGTLSFATVAADTGTISFSGNTITGSGTTVTIDDDLIIPDKITHSGDTNTHIRFPSADTISFETGGSERLRIASAGQIGLADTNYGSNGQVLTSNGASSAPTWQAAGGSTGNITFSGNVIGSSGDIELTPTGSYVKINQRLYITDGGDVNPNYEGDDFNFYGGGGASTTFIGANGAFRFSDNTQVFWGSSADFQIEHENGNNRTIARIGNHPFRFASKTGDDTLLEMNDQAGVKLYWDGGTHPALETVAGSAVKFNNAFTFPTADGSNGQVLQTNGSGTVTWATSGGGGLSGAVVTITAAAAPTSPGSGEAKIYSTNSSGQTGILVHSGNTSEVFQVKYHTTATAVMAINNSGNTDIYGYVAAAYYDKRSGQTGGNFQPSAGYGEGSGLELPGAIILSGSSTYSQYAKPIKMYGKSNAYVNLRPSTSQAASTNFDFILPAAVGSAGQYLKTTGSGVTEWAAVSAGTPNPVDIADASSDQPTTDCIRVGTGYDMRIFHYSNKSYIRIANGGSFGGGGDFEIQDSYGQEFIECVGQGHVKLTHNGSNKLTTAYGNANSITLSGVYTLPGADGSSGQQLTTNGSGTVTFAAASSDERLKKSISANDIGLSFINELGTKIFSFKSYKELDKDDSQLAHLVPQEYTKEGDIKSQIRKKKGGGPIMNYKKGYYGA